MRRSRSFYLHAKLLALRREGASRYECERAFCAWFKQAVAEGHSPDSVAPWLEDERERFESRTVVGPDRHWYWLGGPEFERNDGTKRPPHRQAYSFKLGHDLSRYQEIGQVCKSKGCINPAHWRLVPRSEARLRYTDHQLISYLQVAAMKLGVPPRSYQWTNMRSRHQPTAVIFRKRFGSWDAAIRAAGLVPVTRERR